MKVRKDGVLETYTVAQTTASNLNAQVVGNVADGITDLGNSVKVGGIASNDKGGLTAVDELDRQALWLSLIGQAHVINHRFLSAEINQTALETTYNNVTTSANGADIDPETYRTGTVMIDWEKANAPTRIKFDMEAKSAGGVYHSVGTGFWQNLEYEDVVTGTGIEKQFAFRIPECTMFRFTVVATGTTASATFTVNTFKVHLGT